MKESAATRLHAHILGRVLILCLAGALLFGCGPAAEHDSDADSNPDVAGLAHYQKIPARIAPQEIVFGSDYSGNYEIYVMAPDGSNIRSLTDDPAYDNWSPRISPNRDRILYYRAPFGEGGRYESADLMVMDADGGNIGLLRAVGDDNWGLQAHAEWSPRGDELVMCGQNGDAVHLYITDDQGAVLRQLTFDGTFNCDPSWSPDGRTIVFSRCTGDCGNRMANLDIYTVPASGTGGPQPLTSDGLADYDPAYSPDGTAIAWLTHVDPSAWNGSGSWSIRIMDADGANSRYVIDDHQINGRPAWSLNGDRIYFHRLTPADPAHDRWRIFSICPDGSRLSSIDPFESGNCEYPAN